MLKTRVISGVLLAILIAIITILGGNVFLFIMALLSIGGMYEVYRCAKIEKTTLAMLGYVVAAFFWFFNGFLGGAYNFLFLILSINGLFILYVIQFGTYKLYEVIYVFFGLVYLIGMFYFIQKIRASECGVGLMLLLVIGTWGCDTCAYFSGRLFGKRKLAPVLSPKKTIEGAVGGVAGAVTLGILFVYMFPKVIVANIPSCAFSAIVCFVISIVSQFGDLAASAIKRHFEVKDYGRLIPGHGGILDRFDSMIFSAPVMYLIVLVFT